MQITVDVPDDLALRLSALKGELPRIIELGLREHNAVNQEGFRGAADVLEFLARLPKPEEIIALRPSESLQSIISQLLEKNRSHGLSSDEERRWEQYKYIEHLVRMAKAEAAVRIKSSSNSNE